MSRSERARTGYFGLFGLFWPICGLMAEIDHNFLLSFENSAIYFRPVFFDLLLFNRFSYVYCDMKNQKIQKAPWSF